MAFCIKSFLIEDVKVPMVLVAGSDIAYGVLVYGLQFMLRGRLDFFSYLQHIILPEMVYTVLLTAVLYRPLYRLNRWLTENEWEGPSYLDETTKKKNIKNLLFHGLQC